MLERLYALPELSSLWRIADLCYGIPSPLHLFGRDGLVASLTSERGSRQGCVLGTLLFCLGLQPILEDASRDLDALTVSAYVDDIAAVGPLEQVSVFFERLSSLSPSLGLSLSLSKSSVLWPSDSPVPTHIQRWTADSRIPLVRGAVPLLGSMVGLDSDLRLQFASERVKSMEPFFRALRHPRFTTQAAFVLLRVCALPKFNFSCRTLSPRLTSRACATFDQLVLRTATNILRLDLDSLPPHACSLLTLPTRHGGFGLRRMEATAPAAYLGSLAATARFLPSAELLVAIPMIGELEHALSRCQLPGLKLPASSSFLACAARQRPTALQRSITAAIEDSLACSVGDTPALSSHLLSLRQAGASNWLTTVPSRPELTLPDDDFRLAARLRLRLPPVTETFVSHCGCGSELSPDHFLVCRHLMRRQLHPAIPSFCSFWCPSFARLVCSLFLRLGLRMVRGRISAFPLMAAPFSSTSPSLIPSPPLP
jgi:hypothetical protein